MKEIAFSLLLFFLLFSSCKNLNKKSVQSGEGKSLSVQTDKRDEPFHHLKECMQGSFSSYEQSVSDSDYFDIRLRMVPIWESSPEQFYLYVEQSVAGSENKPYRQRVYRVVKNDNDHFTSFIYLLNQPERFIGKSENDPVFSSITADSLAIKEGCEVHLEWNPASQSFDGSTVGNKCPSDRQGASYASSIVSIKDGVMISWDRGFDSNEQQVWGAKKGGYIFKKIK